MTERPPVDASQLKGQIEELARAGGVRVFGVADLEKAAEEVEGLFDRVGAPFRRAVVMGIPLNPAALEGIVDSPTPLYFHAYRQLNYRLDIAAFRVAQALVEAGHRSLAIAASQIIEKDPPRGHVSHRHLGVAAGLGWIGRSGLLVTPRYGARVRFVTVLTDAPFEAGEGMPFSCGKCVACVSVCPAKAIKRDVAGFDLGACYAKLTEFTRIPYVGQHICGVCVKACAPDNEGRGVDADGNPRET
ncbi:MAG: 4Fe-4S binding protein [Planctomycetota bacterium]|jgi:epoxyqueuosine reductase QueG